MTRVPQADRERRVSTQARGTLRHGLIARLLHATTWKRTLFYIIGDIVVALGAGALVFWALGSAGHPRLSTQGVLIVLLLVSVVQLAINSLFSVYNIKWGTYSFADIPRSIAGSLVSGITLVTLSAADVMVEFSPAAAVAWTVFDIAGSIMLRAAKRFANEIVKPQKGRRTVMVVSSDRSYFLLDLLRRNHGDDYNIVGFVDSDPRNVGVVSQGVPVLGVVGDIDKIVEEHDIKTVLVMLTPEYSLALNTLYSRLARVRGIEIRTLPSLVDMLEGSSRVGELERRAIHELTGRPPISVDLGEMKELYSGRRIMVTGAG
ncbi:MAG: hypothetical protein ABIK62_04705, partial [candidate division WOR-3 bacterium]